VFFIRHNELPKERVPTYVNFVCGYKPHKADPHRFRIMVGRDRVERPGEVATNTADLPVTKAIINSVCSVNTSGKAGAQIPQLPLGGDSSPRGR
jgi:hypothetical protein